MLMADSLKQTKNRVALSPTTYDGSPDYRHLGRANFLMQDGHVEIVAPNPVTGVQAMASTDSPGSNMDYSLFWHGFVDLSSSGKKYIYKPFN